MTAAAPPNHPVARAAGAGVMLLLYGVAVGAAGVGAVLLGESAPMVIGGAVVLAILWFGPIWIFAPLVLLATMASDVIRLEMGDSATAAMFGQGRAIVLIAGLVVLRLMLERQRFPLPRRAFIPIALYILSLFFMALVASASGTLDFAVLQRSVAWVLAFGVGIATMTRPAHRLPALRGMAVVTIFAGVSALLYWAWIVESITPPAPLAEFFQRVWQDAAASFLNPERSRLPWVDHHPNRVAVMFTLLLSFVLPPLLASRSRGDSMLALGAAIAATGGVLATQSRTGLVVLGVSALALSMLWTMRREGERSATPFVVLLIAIPFAIVAYQWSPQDRGFSLQDENLQSRQAIWTDALGTFGDRPLWGHGLNYGGGPNFVGELSAHNEYLGQLVDGGLIGGALFAVVLLSFLAFAWRLSRRPGTDGAIGLGMLTYLGVLVVSMFVATTWRTAGPVIITWLCFGMLTATATVPTEDDAAEEDGGADAT